MRRAAAALLSAAALLAACSASDNGGTIGGGLRSVQQGPTGALRAALPTDVAAAGVIRVGAAVGRAPLMFYATGNHRTEGVDVDLLTAIAHQLGVTVRIVDMPLTDLGKAVLQHQVDLLMSGFVDIKQFETGGLDFIDYMTGSSAVLVRGGNPSGISGSTALCGRRVGFLLGSEQQLALIRLNSACLAARRNAILVDGGADESALVAQLVAGRLDAILEDSLVAAYTAQVSEGAASVEVAGPAFGPVPYAMGFARDRAPLRNAVDAALNAIIRNGAYDQAMATWGGEGDAVHTPAVNAGPDS